MYTERRFFHNCPALSSAEKLGTLMSIVMICAVGQTPLRLLWFSLYGRQLVSPPR